jgi:O-antigen/teichoic acid export membrane protein
VDVALYGLAYKVIEAFIVLPSYFMTALFPEIARMEPHSERLGSVIGQALAVMELIALPVVVLTVVFADEIVQVVGGDQFGDASHALRLLTIGVGVSFLNGVYGNALVALGRQKQLLWLSMAVLVFNVALNLVLIPPFGVDGAATAVAASEVLAYFVVRGLFGRVATTPRRTGRLRVLLAAAGMAVAVPIELALTSAGAGALVVALVGGVAGLVAYIALLIALGAVPAPIEDHILSPLRARLRRS